MAWPSRIGLAPSVVRLALYPLGTSLRTLSSEDHGCKQPCLPVLLPERSSGQLALVGPAPSAAVTRGDRLSPDKPEVYQ